MPTLFCEIGQHSWDRAPQRGRKPRNCPDHRPVIVISQPPSNSSAPVAAVPQGGSPVSAYGAFSGADNKLIALALDKLPKIPLGKSSEIQQIAYIIGQLRTERDKRDHALLTERLNQLIQRH